MFHTSFYPQIGIWRKFCSNSCISSSTYGKEKYFRLSSMREMVIFVTEFVILKEVNFFKRKWILHGGISQIFFLGQFSSSFLGQNCNFRYRFHFEGNYDAWISQVRCVKQHGSLQNCTMMVKMQSWRKKSNVVSVIEFTSKSVNHFINLEFCRNSKLFNYSPVKIGRAIRKMSYFWHHNKKSDTSQ